MKCEDLCFGSQPADPVFLTIVTTKGWKLVGAPGDFELESRERVAGGIGKDWFDQGHTAPKTGLGFRRFPILTFPANEKRVAEHLYRKSVGAIFAA